MQNLTLISNPLEKFKKIHKKSYYQKTLQYGNMHFSTFMFIKLVLLFTF